MNLNLFRLRLWQDQISAFNGSVHAALKMVIGIVMRSCTTNESSEIDLFSWHENQRSLVTDVKKIYDKRHHTSIQSILWISKEVIHNRPRSQWNAEAKIWQMWTEERREEYRERKRETGLKLKLKEENSGNGYWKLLNSL